MQQAISYTLAKAVLFVSALALLQACTPAPQQTAQINVAEAYNSSDVIHLQPYTRTIFSTHNF